MIQKQLWLLFFGVVLFSFELRAITKITDVCYITRDASTIFVPHDFEKRSQQYNIYIRDDGGEFQYCGLRFKFIRNGDFFSETTIENVYCPHGEYFGIPGTQIPSVRLDNGSFVPLASSTATTSSNFMPYDRSNALNNCWKEYGIKIAKIAGWSALSATSVALIIYLHNKYYAKDDKSKKRSVKKWAAGAGLVSGVLATYHYFG